MTIKRIKIGIIQTYLLILIQVLFALTFLIDSMAESFDDNKELIYQIAYAYAYISVLTLIRKLVLDHKFIANYLRWIIRLEALKALSNIFVSIHIYEAKLFAFVSGLVLFVLYIVLIAAVLNRKYNEKTEIIELRPFAIATILAFLVSLAGSIYAEINNDFEIYGILLLIMAIPFGLIIRYLNKMRVFNFPNL